MAKQGILQRIEEGIKESDRFVAKEIMWNLEKFGASPAVAVNGQNSSLRLLHGKDLEAAAEEIAKNNYLLENFWFAEYYQTSQYNPIGRLLVISKKSGKSKQYQFSNSNSWLNEFAKDLKNNFYQE
jgi:hypothetical protein